MSFFDSMNINASALTAQRLRMDVISENIANINTTRAKDGQPYKRKTVLFEEIKDGTTFSNYYDSAINKNLTGKGVKVTQITEDQTPGSKTYEPGHPDADEEGYVTMPNVNIVTELVNMISASRSYEASITAMNNTKAMINKTFELGR